MLLRKICKRAGARLSGSGQGSLPPCAGFLQHDDLNRPESEPFKKFAAGIILPLAFFLKACYNMKGFIGGLRIWEGPSIGRGANHSDGVSLKVASRFSPKANVAEGKDRETR